MWANRQFCRLCECPVVDGGVPASEVDPDKFGDWCLQTLGTELADDLWEDDIFCNSCKWDAEWELNHSDGNNLLTWWPMEGKAESTRGTLKINYFDGIVTRSSAKVDKIFIPENVIKEEGLAEEKQCNKDIRSCIYCGKLSDTRHFKEHMQKFHKDEAIRCEVKQCATYFHSLNEKEMHMESAHQTPTEFPCRFCAKVFNNVSDYNKHARKKVRCDAHKCTARGCSSYFKTSGALNSHCALMHKIDKSAKNTKCNSKTRGKDKMNSHIICSKHSAKKILCDKCPTMFASKSRLHKHMKSCHSYKECKLCQKDVSVGCFKNHSMKKSCVRCKSKFPCSGKLQDHKIVCPKQFKFHI